MIKKRSILISCCFLLLAGCVQGEAIENLQIVESFGYDIADRKKYQLTLAVTMFSPSENAAIKGETISDENYTGYGAAWSAGRKSPKTMPTGKTLVTLFGEELAKEGINDVIDGIERHPTIGGLVDFCVIEGEAKELLEGEYAFGQTVSRYLKSLLEQNKKMNLPITNFHAFMYGFYSKGQTPFMPLIQKEGDQIKLTGLALFKEDKYVDKINANQLFIFKMLYESMKGGTYEASISEQDKYAAIESVESNVNYTVSQGISNPKVDINVEIKAFLNEVNSNVELKNKEDEENLEKLIEEDLKENGLKLIKQFQEKELDPLGIGDKVRSQTRGWESSKWSNLYPNATVDIKTKVDILETGIIN
ncbi:Ger(x)C family spore germination protein [Oceanobacillus sp. FSL K6-2867]|uniref:Ger(x)C family spore germination protein n=1 Tax=Oceanobacillus sp. FSL K6-2867 TaxID=2954748 RepID=UPI0030DC8593